MTALATTLQAFFTDRLARQRQVSPNTIAAYRDTLRLLVVFAADKKGKEPSKLDIDDLDALLIGAFLDNLEHERKNGARTASASSRTSPPLRGRSTAQYRKHDPGAPTNMLTRLVKRTSLLAAPTDVAPAELRRLREWSGPKSSALPKFGGDLAAEQPWRNAIAAGQCRGLFRSA
jgi:site-specific recombinase XerD